MHPMVPRLMGVVILWTMGPTSGTTAGGTITSTSLFGANDAARARFMVLRVKGHADFASDSRGRNTRVRRAFGEARAAKRFYDAIWEKCVRSSTNLSLCDVCSVL